MSTSKSAGRPKQRAPDRVRQLLMEAARGLFSEHEFTAVSVKRIARRAGVNSAMIHYYFGDKRGLYLAIAEEVLGPLLDQLRESSAAPGAGLEDFIQAYTQLLMANPWWPGFLIREVVFGGEAFRDSFAEKFGARVRGSLLALISASTDRGELRADLDPRLTLLSLIGLLVFPFLARPLAGKVLDLDLAEIGAADLARHTTALFLHGTAHE